MDIVWRPYQERAFKAIEKAINEGITRHLLVLATGTGKTAIAVGISKSYNRLIFICHREELIDQAYQTFSKEYPLEVGIIKAQRFELDKKIVIASAQTLHRRLDKIPKDYFDCIIADEFHHFLSPTFLAPLEYFKPKQLFGLTATPTRLDGLNFSNVVDQITFQYPIQQGINEGWLCSLEAYRVKTNVDISGVKRLAGDFNQKELNTKVDIPERNELIVQKYIQYGANRQAIVFCASINHAINVRNTFKDKNISCETVSSLTDPEERKMINIKFKNGEIDVITNVNIYSEGYDYSDVGLILMARPTESVALYIQQLGRSTRLKSDKYKNKFNRKDATIIDFVDNFGNHRLVNHWTIEADVPIKDRVMISDEQKDIYEEKINARREARLKEVSDAEGKVDLFILPKRRNIRHVGRLNEPATEAQLNWLKGEGIWTEGVSYTKGQASEFITNLPAKPWMIRNLTSWKYDTSKMVSVGQYYEVKKAIQEGVEH